MNPNEITSQQAADWCARDEGWEYHKSDGHDSSHWRRGEDLNSAVFSHPYPLTRDGAAAAMPEGWSTEIRVYPGTNPPTCYAMGYRPGFTHLSDTIVKNGIAPDEITARFRLAVACRMAAKEQA